MRPWRPGRSSPLEGSQPGDVDPVPAGLNLVAHHPWRDRNVADTSDTSIRPSKSLITPGGIATCVAFGWGVWRRWSLITPGGIATPWTQRRLPRTRSRSSPLEGSQHGRRGRFRVLHAGVAHHPWRDRNLAQQLPIVGDQRSLITPGGIATWPSRTRCRRSPRVAHHPWRDRNLFHLPGQHARNPVAHHPWRDRNANQPARHTAATHRSLITPGGIAKGPEKPLLRGILIS